MLALLTLVLPGAAAANENQADNPCLTNPNTCMKCHQEEQDKQIFTKARGIERPCEKACANCHKKMKNHHQTGMEVEFDVSADIRLTKDKRVTCITCHDLSVKRYSATARKAQSLFQRMFKGKKRHKSYYLVMDNRGGQLCKQCH